MIILMMTSVGVLLLQLAFYMWNAGEITYKVRYISAFFFIEHI